MKYIFKLTVKEVQILKRGLLEYRHNLKERSKNSYGISLNAAKINISDADDLEQKLCYSLSDQQNDDIPLSQRNYPQ